MPIVQCGTQSKVSYIHSHISRLREYPIPSYLLAKPTVTNANIVLLNLQIINIVLPVWHRFLTHHLKGF